MPTISKQSHGAAKVGRAVAAESAWDLIDTMRVLLYGQSGTGKTTAWASFPGPILALICSGGNKPGELLSINTPEYRRKITPVIINDSAQLKDQLTKANSFATVVLDHVSGLQDLILKEILGLNELPVQKSWGMASQQQYGQCTIQCKEYLRALLNLPGNVVIVGQERVFGGREDGVDGEIIKPTVGVSVMPSLAGWLNPACDYVLQTYKRPKVVKSVVKAAGREVVREERGKGVEYCIRCEPHEVFMTKFRVPKGSKLPDVIVLGEEDSAYEKLLAATQGRL